MKSVLVVCLLVSSLISTGTCEKKKLAEEDVVPAILSTIMGSSSRLELEKHRPNKTLSSVMKFGRDDEANEALRTPPTPETTEPAVEIRPTSMARGKQDVIIRQLWGGTCKLDDWINCNNITTFGGDYFVKDRVEHFEMECTTFKWVCMKNGWTVNRCHLLCMSACNRELLETNKYDRYVLHEGECEPISRG